jgi:tetratricopeptide (TPR) repeat protein
MVRLLAFALLFATATTAAAQGSLEAEARANFEAGRIAFVDGRFADALPYFERAHELTGRPELLYNIGVCRDRIGHDVEALEAFEAYLAAIPDAANRSEVEQRIETARLRVARMAAGAGEPSEDRADPDADEVAPRSADPTGWIVVGAGAAAAAAGAALVGVGASDRAGIEASMGTLSWSDASARASSADGLAIGGAIGLGVGVGLAALGLGLALSVAEPEAPARVEISPTGVRVVW